jgi:hypothetical protein
MVSLRILTGKLSLAIIFVIAPQEVRFFGVEGNEPIYYLFYKRFQLLVRHRLGSIVLSWNDPARYGDHSSW